MGNYQLALEYYEQARQLNPTDHRIPLEMGSIYAERGQPEKAAKLFHLAQSCDNIPLEVQLNLGVALLKVGDETLAVESFKKYIDGRSSELESPMALSADDPRLRTAILLVRKHAQSDGDQAFIESVTKFIAK